MLVVSLLSMRLAIPKSMSFSSLLTYIDICIWINKCIYVNTHAHTQMHIQMCVSVYV
jgi:hypothetical protein